MERLDKAFSSCKLYSRSEITKIIKQKRVTVDGVVIVDGNIRTACKGRNVDPKGSNQNPYTVDKLNHPGLFNKTGHIGLLGHGEGLKYRNIRVKEL